MAGGVPGANPIGSFARGMAAQSPILSAMQSMMSTPEPNTAGPMAGGDVPLQPDSLPQLAALPPAPVDGVEQPPQMATQTTQMPQGFNGRYAPLIAKYAQKWGVDPTTALRVAKAEGGLDSWIQSRVKKGGRTEPSFGPFQMLIGDGVNFPKGMGNQIIEERGIDPRDPRNAEAVIDFAMEQASKHGWGQWYGAKAVGIGNMDGIGGRPAGVSPMTQTVMGGARSANDPAAYQQSMASRMFGGEMQPGEGEQLQKQLAGSIGETTGGYGGGSGPQIQQASETSSGGPAYDDSAEYLQQAAADTKARQQGTGQRAAERKAALRQRVGARA